MTSEILNYSFIEWDVIEPILLLLLVVYIRKYLIVMTKIHTYMEKTNGVSQTTATSEKRSAEYINLQKWAMIFKGITISSLMGWLYIVAIVLDPVTANKLPAPVTTFIPVNTSVAGIICFTVFTISIIGWQYMSALLKIK